MNSTDIIGYTADADTWCPDCAVTEYGGANRNIILVNGVPGFIETPLGNEGNYVQTMFCGEETDTSIRCRRCMEPIETTVLDPERRCAEPNQVPPPARG